MRNIASFRRNPESSVFKWFWTPDFAGVTMIVSFYLESKFKSLCFQADLSNNLVFEFCLLSLNIHPLFGCQYKREVLNRIRSGFETAISRHPGRYRPENAGLSSPFPFAPWKDPHSCWPHPRVCAPRSGRGWVCHRLLQRP